MPRDRANLRTDIWGDGDWRRLSFGAQWLYQHALTHATMTAVGTVDWRPTRILHAAQGLTLPVLREFARELSDAFFLVIDEDTEEALVRSYFRHDGVLSNPNMVKTIKRDYASVTSDLLRGVISHEANRLRSEFPDGMTEKPYNVWAKDEMATLLKSPQIDVRSLPTDDDSALPPPLFETDTPSNTPSETPSDTPSLRGSDRGSRTTTATTTTTQEHLVSSADAEDRTLLPESWAPSQRHRDRAVSLGLDIDRSAYRFTEHARRTNRRQKNWHSAFSNWLTKDIEYRQQDRVHGGTSSTPAAPRRMTAAEQNMARFQQKYGDTTHEPQGDRAALGPGVSDRLADGD